MTRWQGQYLVPPPLLPNGDPDALVPEPFVVTARRWACLIPFGADLFRQMESDTLRPMMERQVVRAMERHGVVEAPGAPAATWTFHASRDASAVAKDRGYWERALDVLFRRTPRRDVWEEPCPVNDPRATRVLARCELWALTEGEADLLWPTRR